MTDNPSTPEENTKADDDAQSLDQALAGSALISAGTATYQSETASTEDEEFEDEIEGHEELGGTFASKVLTGLALLVVGALIALWGAPKLAPKLPAGMSPVKAWLTPGETGARAEIAALKSELDARLAEISQGPSEEQISEIVGKLIAENAASDASGDDEVQAKLDGLSDTIAAVSNANYGERLVAIESKVTGMSGQLESFGSLAESADGLSEDAVAQISKFAATVDGLRSEISGLTARDAALQERIEEVAANAERRITQGEAQLDETRKTAAAEISDANVRNSLSQIRNAVGSGSPFSEPLADLEAELGTAVPAALADNAASGVATLARLRQDFGDAAHAAIRSDIQASSDGNALSRLNAFVGSQVASRSLTPREGTDTDAILSRAEAALSEENNLTAVLAELSGLSAPAAEAMSGWISRATSRQATLDALTDISASASAVN